MTTTKPSTVTDFEKEIRSIYRELHAHPELSNEEFATTRLLKEKLRNVDISILNLPLTTGLVAEIVGDPSGPVIALRCDIDALPITEETALPYQSTAVGKMHACGHDFHAAVILGAAYLLKKQQATLPGTVKIIFQPAEETAHGAEQIIKTGVLSNVQSIFGLHNKPDLPTGSIGTAVGPLTAAVDRFEIEIAGVGTHAAYPEKGIDPIVVAAHLITLLQTIVSRNISAFDQGLISVTHVKSGNTWNVIPTTAFLEGTVRTLHADIRKLIPQKMAQIITGTAESLGATGKLNWYPGPPATDNTAEWVDIALAVAREVGYEIRHVSPGLGGEDFAYYQENIPGAFINIGTGHSTPHHHPKFSIDEAALAPAAKYFAQLAQQALYHLTEKAATQRTIS